MPAFNAPFLKPAGQAIARAGFELAFPSGSSGATSSANVSTYQLIRNAVATGSLAPPPAVFNTPYSDPYRPTQTTFYNPGSGSTLPPPPPTPLPRDELVPFHPGGLPPLPPPQVLPPSNPLTGQPMNEGYFDPLAAPGGPTNPITGGDLADIAGAACGYISNANARALCIAAAGVVSRYSSGTPIAPQTSTAGCPPGSKPDAQGRCMKTGVVGAGQRFIPGGQSGYVWDPATGMGGIPAITPVLVARETLACPGGLILGIDNLCYAKGTIPRQLRKHKPGARPLLSAHDGKILNQAKGLQKKLQRVAGKHVKKPCRCKTGPSRKK